MRKLNIIQNLKLAINCKDDILINYYIDLLISTI